MSPSKLIKFALRLAVSVGLIWWVLRQVDTESFLGQLEKVSPAAFLLPVFVILGFGLIQTARWVLVQQALAAPLPFRLAARTIFLSLFFNQTLPSTIGGDAIRVTYAYRAGLPLNAVVKGVLVDRLSALLALVLMSASTLPLLYQAVGNHPFGGLVTLMVAGGLAGALALLALAALPPALRPRRSACRSWRRPEGSGGVIGPISPPPCLSRAVAMPRRAAAAPVREPLGLALVPAGCRPLVL